MIALCQSVISIHILVRHARNFSLTFEFLNYIFYLSCISYLNDILFNLQFDKGSLSALEFITFTKSQIVCYKQGRVPDYYDHIRK